LEKLSGDRVVCHIIKGTGYAEGEEDYIFKCIKNQLGSDIEVSINYIQKPILAKSGKRVYVINS